MKFETEVLLVINMLLMMFGYCETNSGNRNGKLGMISVRKEGRKKMGNVHRRYLFSSIGKEI